MPVLAEKALFQKHFDQFDMAKHAPGFQSLRQAARSRFRDLSFPTAKTEDWRFTNLAPLLKVPFELPRAGPVAPDVLPPLPTPDTIRLVFVNGSFSPSLSSTAKVAAGVEVGSLGQVRADRANILNETLGLADFKGQVFTTLNTCFLNDGAYVVIPERLVLEQPIELIYLAASGGKTIVIHPRTVVIASQNSQATILERYLSAATASDVYFTNAVTEIVVGESAVVDHYKVQQESQAAYHIANTQVLQGGKSSFSTHYLSLGGGLVRNEVRVRFDAEGSEATVNGLYLAAGKQHVDNFTVIDHAKPHCSSHELYKGVLTDQAQGVFNGKIFVRPDAQKTDAKQTNKVLLLSDSATINTKPQLEIFADDVKCTHGATIGQLDPEQVFYLRSRGIDEQAARALLTFAFANDLVGRIKIEALRDWMEQLLISRNL